MHRSGTSALAGLLHEAGLSLGDHTELMARQAENPNGYAERVDVADLNDRLLESLGWTWDAPDAAPFVVTPDRMQLVDEGRQLVAEAFDETSPWLLKDPRFSLLLPWWRQVLLDRFVAVVVIRPPIETAWSLSLARGLPIELGVALYRTYYRHLAQALIGMPVIIVSYPALAEEPAAIIPRLLCEIERLGVRGPFDQEAAIRSVEPILRRSTEPGPSSIGDVVGDSAMSTWSAWVHEPLRVVDDFRLEAEPPDRWETVLLDFQRRLRRQEGEARRANTELADQLRELRQAHTNQLLELMQTQANRTDDAARANRELEAARSGRDQEVSELQEMLEVRALEINDLRQALAVRSADLNEVLTAQTEHLRELDEIKDEVVIHQAAITRMSNASAQ